MRNTLRWVLALWLAVVAISTRANPVDIGAAREVAAKFASANLDRRSTGEDDVRLVKTYSIPDGRAACYVFNLEPGFVIVAADDCATPILGYSNEGQLRPDDIPVQMETYLKGFVKQLQYGIENKWTAEPDVAAQWESVRLDGYLRGQKANRSVSPLLSSRWDQGCYYNNLCPADSDGSCGHVATGCVATAMAQVMRYWGYPTTGQGTHSYTPDGYATQYVNFGATTYNWSNMPDRLYAGSSSTQVNAVATLMWHCGVAANMQYGAQESWAYFDDALSGLKDYFKYPQAMFADMKSDNTSWLQMVKICLDHDCPLFYCAQDDNGHGGHAFVCDGYDSNDYIHFNWGWDGYGDGYFPLDALDVDELQFNTDHYAIFNFTPNTITFTQSVSASPSNGGTVSGAGTYNLGITCTLRATPNTGYSFSRWLKNGSGVSTSATYSFKVLDAASYVAVFTPNSYSITASASPSEGGMVTGAGTYSYGSTCTLNATALPGYSFVRWTKNGSQVSTNASYQFTVTENASYVAVFAETGYTITATASPAEGGTVSGAGNYGYGSLCTLTATPNAGYTFDHWSQFGESVSTNASYSFYVYGNVNLVAVFSEAVNMELLNGVFSIGENNYINFSRGNLQYKASTNKWRFANLQYDHIGDENANISETYSGWIDLFGWGTSGYNHGASCYQPWSTNGASNQNYYVYGSAYYNLYDQTGQADWGYNAIINGGNTENSGWRTLTHEEWVYLLNDRTTNTGIRYVHARVNNVNGLIILPDNWSESYCNLNSINDEGPGYYTTNIFSADQWETLEQFGAVFLPVSGYRALIDVYNSDYVGYYWSSSYCDSDFVYHLLFSSESCDPSHTTIRRGNGYAVRLVRSSENTLVHISAVSNPSGGGVVLGTGVYEPGQVCVLTATPNEGYVFVNWTENGNAVSTDPNYSFTVTGARDLVAVFEVESTIYPEENLVAYYPFDGNVNDYSGNGHHGTINGNVVPETDRFGNPNGAYRFPGESFNYISVPDADDLHMNAFTLSAWVYTDADAYGSGYLICKGRDISNGGYHLTVTDVAAVVQYGGTNGAGVSDIPTTYEWHMITGTVEGDQACFYVDGILQDTRTLSKAFTYNNSDPLSLGMHYYSGVPSSWAYPLLGVMDEVRIYNRAFSAQEVLDLYCSSNGVLWSISDDFDDGVINADYWTATGSDVLEEDGLLKLQQNVTDSNVALESVPMAVPSNDVIVIDRKFLVHEQSHSSYWGDRYFYGSATIKINGSDDNYVGICYYDDDYENRHGTYLRVQLNGETTETRICDATFDTWLTERIVLDAANESLSYFLNNALVATLDVAGIASQQMDHYTVAFRPYGWWTGHYHNMDYVNINVLTAQTQTDALPEGWSWWSLAVEASGEDALAQLEENLVESGVMIKSRLNGFVNNYDGLWLGSLTTIENESSYLIQTTAPCELMVTGLSVDPSLHPISIEPGWNWIGYPCRSSMSVTEALSGLTPSENDMLKSRDNGFTVYYPGIGWMGSLNTILPGMGLMYQSQGGETMTLTYPTAGKSEPLEKNASMQDHHWMPTLQPYPDNMTLLAVVEVDGKELRSDRYELGVFAGNECRGSASLKYEAALDRYVAYLTVFGEEPTPLRFGLYDGETGEERFDAESEFIYMSNDSYGIPAAPFVVRFTGATALDAPAIRVNLFPNPVDRGRTLLVSLDATLRSPIRVEVVNEWGAVMSCVSSNEAPVRIKAPESAGVYLLRVVVEGKGSFMRKLVVN